VYVSVNNPDNVLSTKEYPVAVGLAGVLAKALVAATLAIAAISSDFLKFIDSPENIMVFR
jgi:hypothetical protein